MDNRILAFVRVAVRAPVFVGPSGASESFDRIREVEAYHIGGNLSYLGP